MHMNIIMTHILSILVNLVSLTIFVIFVFNILVFVTNKTENHFISFKVFINSSWSNISYYSV